MLVVSLLLLLVLVLLLLTLRRLWLGWVFSCTFAQAEELVSVSRRQGSASPRAALPPTKAVPSAVVLRISLLVFCWVLCSAAAVLPSAVFRT